ncbi:NAD(P)/FAD-dependent oxidoreductase [Chungangia koreensis]|uniref:NADH:ubiquinone reductase (non-electrogenic) n=1 Tax=Chungangia koreensis TaxID=752657 RepID=A0ABV8X044_9LACT
MTRQTIVVVGGGHAGIHAVKAIQKRLKKVPFRLVLLDPQPAHVRKVLLFKAAVGESELTVPWSDILPLGTEFIRGAIHSVNPSMKCLEYRDQYGTSHLLDYDVLVLAIGSVVRNIDGDGFALSNIENARQIHGVIEGNIQRATTVLESHEKRRLLTLAVVGGGISGIETAFELNQFMRTMAKTVGVDPEEVQVQLVHSRQNLLPDGTEKLRQKLLEKMNRNQIVLRNDKIALKQEGGMLLLSNGEKIPIGTSVWTVGLQPNPVVQSLGLPFESDGRLKTDPSYRIIDSEGIYSIGDCANIVDPSNGKTDGMTCKEAISQANRLGKIIALDLIGYPAPKHQSIRKTFCFSLGTGDALVSAKVFGVEMIIENKIAWIIRKITWNLASFVN